LWLDEADDVDGSFPRSGPGRLWWRLVNFGFRLLYNEMAWTYDAVSWVVSLGQWRRWQLAALPHLHGRDVLEIAHGPGHLLLEMKRQSYRVTGLDLSPWMGRRAGHRLRRAGLPATLVRGEAQSLPFAPASFDAVLSTFPTEFVIWPETLAAVHRVLRPGGRFVIVPEARLTGQGPIYTFLEWLYTITGQRRTAQPAALGSGDGGGQSGGAQPLAKSGDPGSVLPDTHPWREYGRRFAEAGFEVQLLPVEQAKSRVTVVVALKRQAVIGTDSPAREMC
jgi:ubiquinone/menaquinone biosynthesis C-methylase UbiE